MAAGKVAIAAVVVARVAAAADMEAAVAKGPSTLAFVSGSSNTAWRRRCR